MSIGKTYTRTSPSGDKTTVTISNQKELEYYQYYQDRGFRYEEKVIHSSPQVCTSCEG